MTHLSRRGFLQEVGRGMVVAATGVEVASQLGIVAAEAADGGGGPLAFGPMEGLVGLMQECRPDDLVPALARRLEGGTSLRELVAAGALANARSFGGEDYVGFHTLMALPPSLAMADGLSGGERALPVMKVLYRNTSRIQECGGRSKEVLRSEVVPGVDAVSATTEGLLEAVHAKDVALAEARLAALAGQSPRRAFESVVEVVGESPEVHRVVLPYRAWDLLDVVGEAQAVTMLRQSVRYCIRNEDWSASRADESPRRLLPKLLEEHRLLGREPGTRLADDGWMEGFIQVLFETSPEQAAAAAAAALAEGMSPDSVAEAASLAANQLVLRDHGRPPAQEVAGKPIGSVHGDSIGVHASDSANAWRTMARGGSGRHAFVCAILAAWQVARDRVERGGDFARWEPLPLEYQRKSIKSASAEDLLHQLDEAVRGNLQARATAVAACCEAQGVEPAAVFNRLLRFAVSEDGALHGEKYFRTTQHEFQTTRARFRWRHLLGLARVTASEYGRPAPGVALAREVLGV